MKQDGGADNCFSTFLSSKMTINPFCEAKITSNQTMWKALVQIKVFRRDRFTLLWRKNCVMWWQVTTFSELKAYRKLLLNFVYYNFLFTYTLTKIMRLNRVSAIVHGELTNVAMLQLCSSTEFITWVALLLSVHGKNGMHLIFLGNLLLKCFLQQSQDFQPYSDNQIKEIEKRCIQNSEHMERSLAYVGC